MTLVVITSASVLINQLSRQAEAQLEEQMETIEALAEAKAALIAYATTYPDNYAGTAKAGPGYLPCPDTTIDNPSSSGYGTPDTPCGPSAIGRLPHEILDLSNLRDGSGERLWYALSDNFRNNPKLASGLNSETPGQLTLDSAMDPVVALIFAPGPPTDGQSGRKSASTNVANFLEDENVNGDQYYVSSASGEFNDRVMALTHSELMAAIEKRVVGEVSSILEAYRTAYGAYPWLSAFADPQNSTLTGTATAGSSGNTLEDANVDFIALGTRVGDVALNTTDGSRGIIDAVTTNTISVDGLFNGSDNSFELGENYAVSRFNRSFDGAVGATEGLLPFHEVDEGFRSNFVVNWNLQDSNGAVIDVSSKDPIVVSGTHTGSGGSLTTLNDSTATFQTDGVLVGTAILNTTDGSAAAVVSVNSQTQITTTALTGGTDNDFDNGDAYATEKPDPLRYIGRYLASLQSFVETTALSGSVPVGIDDGICIWTTRAAIDCTGAFTLTYVQGTATKNDSDELEDSTRDFDFWGVSPGAIVESVSDSGAWAIVDIVNNDTLRLHEDLTGGHSFSTGETYRVRIPTTTTIARFVTGGPANSDVLYAAVGVDFAAMGVKVGDVLQNVDDPEPFEPEWGQVTAVGDPNPHNLTVPGMDFDNGERYIVKAIYIAQRAYSFTLQYGGSASVYGASGNKLRRVCTNGFLPCTVTGSAGPSSNNLTLDGGSINFQVLGVQVGDLVERKGLVSGDESGGLVSNVSGNSLTVSSLHGPGAKEFIPVGDVYEIYLTETLGGAPGGPSLSIVDKDSGGGAVGGASVTIPSVGSPTGVLYVTGLHVDLEVETPSITDFDLPTWFTENHWHRLIYVAASSDVLPGAGGVCTGTNCLTVTGVATPDDDKELLLIAAGAPLATQDRTVGTACGAIEPAYFCDYFEGENADFDFDESGPPPPTFEQANLTKTFNDTVRVLEP